jgi:hypothetical protein
MGLPSRQLERSVAPKKSKKIIQELFRGSKRLVAIPSICIRASDMRVNKTDQDASIWRTRCTSQPLSFCASLHTGNSYRTNVASLHFLFSVHELQNCIPAFWPEITRTDCGLYTGQTRRTVNSVPCLAVELEPRIFLLIKHVRYNHGCLDAIERTL